MPETSGRPRIPVSYDDTTPLPPWEKRVARVPYMTSKTDPLTVAEKEALSSYWAADDLHTTEQRQSRTLSSTQASASLSVKQILPEAENNRYPDPACVVPAPFLSPPPPAPPPKDHYPAIPPGPKTTPHLPIWIQAPPSPPESAKSSSSSVGTVFSIEQSRSDICAHTDPAAPFHHAGTMTAQHRSPARSRSRSAYHKTASRSDACQPKIRESPGVAAYPPAQDRSERPKFGMRFKSALKDMFKRDPIDETKLERISDRHWTEE